MADRIVLRARVSEDKSVAPPFLFAVLLWPAILRAAGTPEGPLPSDLQLLHSACDTVFAAQLKRVAIPRRFSLPMREIVLMQPRFERRQGRRALRLLEHPRFRAAYDFMLLRASAGEADPELATWWTDLQQGNAEAPPPTSNAEKRRRPRRRRRAKRSAEASTETQ